MTSPLALGEWLKSTFGEEILARRRARERATEALEKGAPLVLEAVPLPAQPVPVELESARTAAAPGQDSEVAVAPAVDRELPAPPSAAPADVAVRDPGPFAPRSRRATALMLVAAALVGAILATVLAVALRP
jgi:hypothetical protein